MGTAFYNIAGTVNTAFILLSLLGVGAQLRLVRNRRERADATDSATAVLSLNQLDRKSVV